MMIWYSHLPWFWNADTSLAVFWSPLCVHTYPRAFPAVLVGLTLYTKKTKSMLNQMERVSKSQAQRKGPPKFGPKTKEQHEKTRVSLSACWYWGELRHDDVLTRMCILPFLTLFIVCMQSTFTYAINRGFSLGLMTMTYSKLWECILLKINIDRPMYLSLHTRHERQRSTNIYMSCNVMYG